MKPAEIRELDDSDLARRLGEFKQELFNLRFQVATNQLDNTARIVTVRREAARIATLMREQEIEAFHQTKGEGR